MVGNPAEKPPFATVLSSNPPSAVLSKIPFPACYRRGATFIGP
jgi:hypothetical protein